MSSQSTPEPLDIQHTILDYEIYYYDNVSSTNDIAKEIAKKGGKEKTVILAETQTYGKGRLGRRWISPKGGIWFSVILRPRISPKEALKLTFIASLAVAKAIKKMFGLKIEVKWPNDVLVNSKKICGILTETSVKEDLIEFAVVGVGINANIDLEVFPSHLRGKVTSLKHELGYRVRRRTLTRSILQNFEHHYKRLQQGQWDILRQEWKSMAAFLGEQVEVTNSSEVFVGKAWDLDEDGALIIRRENGTLKKIVVGDVMVRKHP